MTDQSIYPSDFKITSEEELNQRKKDLQELITKAKTNTNTNTINVNVVNGLNTVGNVVEGIGDNLDKFADLLRGGLAKAQGKKVSKYVPVPYYTVDEMKKMLLDAVNNGETYILLDANKIKPEDYASFKMNKNYTIGEYEDDSMTTCCANFGGKLIEVGKVKLEFNFSAV